MNKAIEIGRLTRDPEVRYSQGNNTAVARYTIAVDRKFKREGEQTADFIPCVVFGKTGGVCREVFQKRNKSCYFWKNHNRKLYKQGWSENIYH